MDYFASREKHVLFSMAIGNVKLVQEYFSGHLCTGTVKLKYDKETEKEGKPKKVKMERSTAEV